VYLDPRYSTPVLRDLSMRQGGVSQMVVDLVVVLRGYVGAEVCTGDRYRYRSEIPSSPRNSDIFRSCG